MPNEKQILYDSCYFCGYSSYIRLYRKDPQPTEMVCRF